MTKLLGHQDEDKRARRVTLVQGDITGNDPESNQVSVTNPLPVSLANVDIQIGAVEIKNHDSDVRTTVFDLTDPTIASTDNPLLTANLNYGYDPDATDWKKLQVSVNNGEVRLKVDATTRPSGAQQNNQLFQDPAVPKNGGSSTSDFVVPTGTDSYFVERFQGGGYTAIGKIELWYGTPAVNEVGMTLIQVVYINGQNNETSVNTLFDGDGTVVLRTKLVNQTSSDDEMFGQIVGFDA